LKSILFVSNYNIVPSTNWVLIYAVFIILIYYMYKIIYQVFFLINCVDNWNFIILNIEFLNSKWKIINKNKEKNIDIIFLYKLGKSIWLSEKLIIVNFEIRINHYNLKIYY